MKLNASDYACTLSAEALKKLKAEREQMKNPFDRIAIDNTWVGSLPLGLRMMAFEDTPEK